MLCQGKTEELRVLGVLFRGQANDVLLCHKGDLAEREEQGVSVIWQVKNRQAVKYLLREGDRLPFEACVSQGAYTCFLIPYREPRPVDRFWDVQISEEKRVQMCREIVCLCMTSRLPWPVLYLLLKGGCLNIGRDDALYFTYNLDLAGLNEERGEQDCAQLCAQQVLRLLRPETKPEKRLYELVARKLDRARYRTLFDLYLEWKWPSPKPGCLKPPEKLKKCLLYILVILACLLLALAIITVVSGMMLGEPFLSPIFTETFRRIGTENLGR